MTDALVASIAEALGETVRVEASVSGGDINRAARLRAASGEPLFVKYHPGAPEGMFGAEAHGLGLLKRACAPWGVGGCRIPEVRAVAADFLVLAWVETGPAGPDFAKKFGQALARMHRHTSASYGLETGAYCGLTPQPAGTAASWVPFFRDQRLGYQRALLQKRGIPPELDRALGRLLDRLDTWLYLPSEPPALIHGDLWGGNYLVGVDGRPVLIDPAAYFGCREADLAMTELFGGFPAGFMAAYHEAWPLEPGYAERRDLYNLYHILNHANLFGGGYARQALSICRRYVG